MKKNRAWVKWAAIGFFAIMALLTFFSGTIRNLTLPEVTTQPVTPGTISPVVACGGITEAGPPTELLATRAGTVTKVLVKAGDRVKTGDVLIRVDYPDDGSLAALQVQLAQQEAAFAEAQLSASAPTDSGAWAEYQILKNNLDDAQQRQTRCQEYTGKRSSLNSQLSAANKELDAAQNAYHTAVDAAAATLDGDLRGVLVRGTVEEGLAEVEDRLVGLVFEHDTVRRIRRVVDVLEHVLHVTGIADAHFVLFEGICDLDIFRMNYNIHNKILLC